MIFFMGESFAAVHLRDAARAVGLPVTDKIQEADLIFVSEDTPTDENGVRDLDTIRMLVSAAETTEKPIVLTSQVPPGFTRSLNIPTIIHQAEPLRIRDAWERAIKPEQIIIGTEAAISPHYAEYLLAFQCPVLRMTWEEAEFAKIAINMTLASQVENSNRLSAAAEKLGVRWDNVAKVLKLDRRIGPYSYLMPGTWQASKHLFRDSVTLQAIECT